MLPKFLILFAHKITSFSKIKHIIIWFGHNSSSVGWAPVRTVEFHEWIQQKALRIRFYIHVKTLKNSSVTACLLISKPHKQLLLMYLDQAWGKATPIWWFLEGHQSRRRGSRLQCSGQLNPLGLNFGFTCGHVQYNFAVSVNHYTTDTRYKTHSFMSHCILKLLIFTAALNSLALMNM